MQDKYAGDVGDFAKLNLLRTLLSGSRWKLGVIWYRHPDEGNGDGRHTNYLESSEFLACDRDLALRLKHVVNNDRSISAIEKSEALPGNAVFFGQTVECHDRFRGLTLEAKAKRQGYRIAWAEQAAKAVSDCDAIFLDPDNGLEISSCRKINQKKAGKYAYYNEVALFAHGKKIVVIYQHLGRNGSHDEQIVSRKKKLQTISDSLRNVQVIRFNRYSPRAFFVLSGSKTINKHCASKLEQLAQHDAVWGRSE